MTLKYIIIWAVTATCVLSAMTELKSPDNIKDAESLADDERIAALYIKDSENGELRFLTGGTGLNSALNQYITQKQNMLEQLRPTTTNNNFGTLTSSGTGATGSFISTGSSGSVSPIIVNLGSSSATSSNSVSSAALASSPIGDLLPQIIAQATFGNQRISGNNIRRRNVNRRRRPAGNRNRKNKPKVVLVRPNRQG